MFLDRIFLPTDGKTVDAQPRRPHPRAEKIGCWIGGAGLQAATINYPVAPLGAGKVGCLAGKWTVKGYIWGVDKLAHPKFEIPVIERSDSGGIQRTNVRHYRWSQARDFVEKLEMLKSKGFMLLIDGIREEVRFVKRSDRSIDPMRFPLKYGSSVEDIKDLGLASTKEIGHAIATFLDEKRGPIPQVTARIVVEEPVVIAPVGARSDER